MDGNLAILEKWNHLSFDYKDFSWLMGNDGIMQLLQQTDENDIFKLYKLGMTDDWIERQIKVKKFRFRLYLFRIDSIVNARPLLATWDNIKTLILAKNNNDSNNNKHNKYQFFCDGAGLLLEQYFDLLKEFEYNDFVQYAIKTGLIKEKLTEIVWAPNDDKRVMTKDGFNNKYKDYKNDGNNNNKKEITRELLDCRLLLEIWLGCKQLFKGNGRTFDEKSGNFFCFVRLFVYVFVLFVCFLSGL